MFRSFFHGRPYNNLLITAFKALGMREADYQVYDDLEGFGGYNGGHGAEHYADFVMTAAASNAPLP